MILDFCINGKDLLFVAGAYVICIIFFLGGGQEGYHRDDSAYNAYILYQWYRFWTQGKKHKGTE